MSEPGSAPPSLPATLPAPAWHEWLAPPIWQAVDLVSDLHLCEGLPHTLQAFEQHLRHTTADAVFILGDLFEVWVGDDMRHRAFEQRCVAMLHEASQRLTLGFMVGNRDFLLGEDMRNACGLQALPDPTVLQACGHRLLLSHGDALCLADTAYQGFRQEVRSSAWQSSFLARPLAQRLQIAAEIRQASQTRRQFDGDASADLDPAQCLAWLQAAGADTLVHGHTHRPGLHSLAPGRQRQVLSDWDLDHAQRAEVLRLTHRGLERRAPSRA